MAELMVAMAMAIATAMAVLKIPEYFMLQGI
jgi:hypothetical protein